MKLKKLYERRIAICWLIVHCGGSLRLRARLAEVQAEISRLEAR